MKPEQRTIHQPGYASIFILHSNELTDMQKDIIFWLEKGGQKVYKNLPQYEKAMEVVWLEYSTRQMDKYLLARAILCDSGI